MKTPKNKYKNSFIAHLNFHIEDIVELFINVI